MVRWERLGLVKLIRLREHSPGLLTLFERICLFMGGELNSFNMDY
jgi:hypothetical protein